MRQAIVSCYQPDLLGLTRIQSEALSAYRGGFISLGKLSETMGLHVLALREWLREHGIPQNNCSDKEDARPCVEKRGFTYSIRSRFQITRFAGRLDLLAERYKGRMLVTPQVLDEIDRGIAGGYRRLSDIHALIGRGVLVESPLGRGERRLYGALLASLGSGEASCIALAASRKGIVATDDLAARNACRENGVLFTGTIGSRC